MKIKKNIYEILLLGRLIKFIWIIVPASQVCLDKKCLFGSRFSPWLSGPMYNKSSGSRSQIAPISWFLGLVSQVPPLGSQVLGPGSHSWDGSRDFLKYVWPFFNIMHERVNFWLLKLIIKSLYIEIVSNNQ